MKPRTAAVLFACGFAVLLVSPAAFAQTLTGGCTAQIGTRDPHTMTRGKPLLVSEGETVVVQGIAPAGTLRGAGEVRTSIRISIIEGVLEPKDVANNGTGVAWGDGVDVDAYLDKSTGLYRVEGIGTGPGWSCAASGYIKLKGNPLAKLVGQGAAAVAAVGLVGTLLARGLRKPEEGRKRGHPIYGFLFGLLLGVGGTVLLQQYAVWPLTVITAFVVPGAVAVLGAIHAWIGRPYRVARLTE